MRTKTKDTSIKLSLSEREMNHLENLAEELGFSKSRIVQEIVDKIILEYDLRQKSA